LVLTNEVTPRLTRLVLRELTISGWVSGKPSQYITNHQGQLSPAIPLWIGAMSRRLWAI